MKRLLGWVTLFLYYTGLRISEALSLNICDVDNRSYVKICGKGKKRRTIKLSKKASNLIKMLIKRAKIYYPAREADIPLFVSQKGNRLSRNQAYILVKKFEYITDKPIRISPHTLRHTFATISLRNGVDIKHVSTQLGHSSVAITQDIYQHSTLDDLNFVDIL